MANTFNHNDKVVITADGTLMVGLTSQTYSNASYGYVASFKSAVSNQAFISIVKSGQTATSEGMLVGHDNSSGYIYLYDNKSLTFYTNSTEAMRISAAGNVGIGTTSPGYTLQIGSTSANSSAAIIGNSTAGIEIRTNSAGGRIAALEQYFASEGSLWLYLSNTTKVLLRANGNSYFNGGNVGIGTTSPSAKLTVDGSVRSRYVILGGTSGDSADNSIEFVSALNSSVYIGGHINYHGAGNLTLVNGGGNVGIGTSSPSAKLHVNPSTTNEIAILINGTQTYSANNYQRISAGDQYSSNRAAIGFGYNSSTEWDIKYSSYSNHSFWTGNDWGSSTEKMRITSAGNVGIGTTSPTVHSGGNALVVAGKSGTGSGRAIIELHEVGGSSGKAVFQQVATTTYIGNLGGNGGLSLLTGGSGSNASESMFISSGGDVGINTTSPAAKLHIVGPQQTASAKSPGAIIQQQYYDPGSGGQLISSALTLRTTNSGGDNWASGAIVGLVGNPGDTSNYPGGLAFYTKPKGTAAADVVEAMRIAYNSNVGIGTTSPSYALHINGNGSGLNLSGGNNRIYFGGNRAIEGSSDGGTLQLGEGYTQVLLQGSNVSIGGTSSSLGPLNVAADSGANAIFIIGRSSGNAGRIDFYTNNQASRLFTLATGDGATQLYGDANIPMTFSTNGTERMRITSAGDVGIGTTSPGAKLDVAGDSVDSYIQVRSQDASIATANESARVRFSTSNETFVGHVGYVYRSATQYGVHLSSKDDIHFEVNNTTSSSMVLNASGNVGIGTTSPSYKVSIVSDSGQQLELINSANSKSWRPNVYGSDFAITETGASIPFIIKAGGNVGIGTTSPAAKLRVAGSIQADGGDTFGTQGDSAAIYISNNTGIGLSGNISGYSRNLIRFSGTNIEIGQNNTALITGVILTAGNGTGVINLKTGGDNSRLYITSGGNVGIGTTSPSQKLEVVGNLTLRGGNRYILGDGGDLYIDTENVAGRDILLQTQSGQNVGIGTTSPAYKLDVSGGAIAIRGNAAGNSLRFDDSGGTSRNAMYVDTSNYLNIGNANYAGVKFVQTATAPNAGAFDGQNIQQAVGTTDDGVVLAAPDAWLAVRVGTTDYAIPMYTTG